MRKPLCYLEFIRITCRLTPSERLSYIANIEQLACKDVFAVPALEERSFHAHIISRQVFVLLLLLRCEREADSVFSEARLIVFSVEIERFPLEVEYKEARDLYSL
jgi:hypothetical protein